MDYIFATNNPGKMREIKSLFAASELAASPDGMTIRSLADIGFAYEAVEDGDTFTENAIKKARGCAQALQENGLFTPGRTVVLADDSGLAIDALDGQPGVHSARFMGTDTPYTEKNRRLLDMLRAVPDEKRGAQFICVIACVLPDGQLLTAEGVVEGVIAHTPSGENGFGYDPIFYLPAYGLTTAELPSDEKNRISHRGRAIRAMLAKLA